MKSVAILLILAPFLMASGQLTNPTTTAKGQWFFKDCLLLQFDMNFTIHNEIENKTQIVSVSEKAKVDEGSSSCGNKNQTDQYITIRWNDQKLTNSTPKVDLPRHLVITFRQNITGLHYGLFHMYAEFMMDKYVVNGTEHVTNVTINSGEIPHLEFHTPLDRSFACHDIGNFALDTTLKFSTDPTPHTLPKTNITTTDLKFDAFRTSQDFPPPTGFRNPLDCNYEPNDVVPIAVGVALAILVIVVLIAYMVGRRRNRQRGYQSV